MFYCITCISFVYLRMIRINNNNNNKGEKMTKSIYVSEEDKMMQNKNLSWTQPTIIKKDNKKTLDQQFTEMSGIDVSKRERGQNLEPVVGMGVTRSIGGDSYPYTIIEMLKHPKGKTILKIENDSDLYEHDTFDIFPNGKKYKREKTTHYLIQEEKLDQNELSYTSWVDIKWNETTKRWNKGDSFYYSYVGQRSYHLDPSF